MPVRRQRRPRPLHGHRRAGRVALRPRRAVGRRRQRRDARSVDVVRRPTTPFPQPRRAVGRCDRWRAGEERDRRCSAAGADSNVCGGRRGPRRRDRYGHGRSGRCALSLPQRRGNAKPLAARAVGRPGEQSLGRRLENPDPRRQPGRADGDVGHHASNAVGAHCVQIERYLRVDRRDQRELALAVKPRAIRAFSATSSGERQPTIAQTHASIGPHVGQKLRRGMYARRSRPGENLPRDDAHPPGDRRPMATQVAVSSEQPRLKGRRLGLPREPRTRACLCGDRKGTEV